MGIHFKRAFQQCFKVFKAQRQCDWHTDRRPGRVTTTHPIPEFKHVGGVDTKFSYCFGVGRQCGEMFRYMNLIASNIHKPVTRRQRISHGFLSREGLRGHQEQCGFWINIFQRFCNVSAIDVRNKMHLQVIFERTQRFSDHHWA